MLKQVKTQVLVEVQWTLVGSQVITDGPRGRNLN